MPKVTCRLGSSDALRVFSVRGRVTLRHLIEGMERSLEYGPAELALWNAEDADLSDLSLSDLGTLVTSNNIGQFGLTIVNNTGTTFDNFTLSYVGEQWRRGDITTPPNDKLTFSYGLGGAINVGGLTTYAPLSFGSPNLQGAPLNVALNGNLAGNQTAISSTVNFTWATGQTLVLKWAAGDITGQDDGLGIDNRSFTAGVVPEPAAICLAMFGVAALVGCGLRDRSRSYRVRG